MKKHFSIRITGNVQGVFFRASTKNEADKLGLTGFTRNEPDGSVYVEAEGEEEALNTFLSWCHHGPRLARVDRVDKQEGEWKGFQKFTIER